MTMVVCVGMNGAPMQEWFKTVASSYLLIIDMQWKKAIALVAKP